MCKKFKVQKLSGIKDLKNRKTDIEQQSWNAIAMRHNGQSVRKLKGRDRVDVCWEQMRECGAGVHV